MRAGGRIQAAIDILFELERRDLAAAAALAEWGRAHRFAGSADRVAIGNLLYDALRRRRSAAARLGSDTPRAAVIGAFLMEQDMLPDKFDALVAGDRFAPEALSPGERKALAAFDAHVLPPTMAGDVPDWCAPALAAAFGSAWTDEARALAARPPLDLRVNRLKASRDRVLEELLPHGAAAMPISPDGVRIPAVTGSGRHPNLQGEPAFLEGRIEVQDEGSQLAAILAVQGGNLQVLDFCAGGGGKTLAMAACLGNRGQIHAWDADRRRLAPIHDRSQRAGCRNVQIMSSFSDLEQLIGRMDLVLVDAPCTGSGTWRRRPDAKWRLSPSHLAQRVADQDAILRDAARYVRPGGRLVYVTCSMFAAENDDRIEAFLAVSPECRAIEHGTLWRDVFPDHPGLVHVRPNGLALTPARTGTDGFFISIMTCSG